MRCRETSVAHQRGHVHANECDATIYLRCIVARRHNTWQFSLRNTLGKSGNFVRRGISLYVGAEVRESGLTPLRRLCAQLGEPGKPVFAVPGNMRVRYRSGDRLQSL